MTKISELIDNKISNLKTEEAKEEPEAEAEAEAEEEPKEEPKEEVEEEKEEEEDTTKGEVGEAEPEAAEESLSNKAIVGYDKEGLCKGVTISRADYEGFKRLSNTDRYEWE
jgi:outer membrane biosynthesis protein TonB